MCRATANSRLMCRVTCGTVMRMALVNTCYMERFAVIDMLMREPSI